MKPDLFERMANPDLKQENELFNFINQAVIDAEEFSLQIEVFMSALKIMKQHPDMEITEVVREAMIEWDVW